MTARVAKNGSVSKLGPERTAALRAERGSILLVNSLQAVSTGSRMEAAIGARAVAW
jgi:hypothetical protein